MFGLTAFYRGDRIFTCVPHKRTFYDPHTVIFKFDPLSAETGQTWPKGLPDYWEHAPW